MSITECLTLRKEAFRFKAHCRATLLSVKKAKKVVSKIIFCESVD